MNDVKCPHCKYEHHGDDLLELFTSYVSGAEGIVSCSCGKEFKIYLRVETTIETDDS